MKIFAQQLLTKNGWKSNHLLTINHGIIESIEPGNKAEADYCKAIIIPGMTNCHSHAFQRALAGFTEQGSDSNDSFWTWRSKMYQFVEQLNPERVQVIATQLYIEMLKMGYTRVAEFHYLHHQRNGKPHSPLDAMSTAIFNAANASGIGLTLLPVLYQYSGFGQLAPTAGQQRFINSTAQFNQLVSQCFEQANSYRNCNVGIAPHSLRAVDKIGLESAIKHLRQLDQEAPIHIHIAEQTKEINDCVNYYHTTPVDWLFTNFAVDDNWCLIHATHLTDNEITAIANSQAVVGICPTTEANLGDGIFPTAEFLEKQGRIAIGSDSHISVNPTEELRWLEYAQRLTKQQRAVLSHKKQRSVGLNLWQQTALNGSKISGNNAGEIAVGKQADLLTIDSKILSTYASDTAYILDSLLFASHNNWVQDVMVNGRWLVKDGHHALEQSSQQAFSQLLNSLNADTQ